MGGEIPVPSLSLNLSAFFSVSEEELALNCDMSLPILFMTSSAVGSFLSAKKIFGFKSLFNPNPLQLEKQLLAVFFCVEVMPFDLNAVKPVLLWLSLLKMDISS